MRRSQQRSRSSRHVLLAILSICLTLSVGACSKAKATSRSTTTTSLTTTTRQTTTTTTTTAGAAPSDDQTGFDATKTVLPSGTARSTFGGFWSGDWGNMVMRVDADGTIVAAYAHDEGEIVGRIDDRGRMVGWWCEVPSRQADNDAGTVEMRLVAGASGASIDGRWTYGAHSGTNTWHENWDISAKGTEAPPAELTARLDTVKTDCVPPT